MSPPILLNWRVALPIVFMGATPFAHALTPNEIFEAVKDSVVVVKTFDAKGKEKGQGSGVLLPSGKVGTNCHVVEGGANFQVGRNKTFIPATLHAGDRDKDICLLDAPGIKGRAAQLGKAVGLKVGEAVYAVGAPQGLELSLSDGIVSQLRGGKAPLIQTTAAISPGSSGGGLFDVQARLVGFTTLYLEGGQSLNFAVPVEWLTEIKPGNKPIAKDRGTADWHIRSIALEAREDWKGLLDWCRHWTKAEPGNAVAWFSLGVTYGKLNRYNDAIEAHHQALRINPEHADTWISLGVAYSRLNRPNDAVEVYRQALRIDQELAAAWNNLGNAYGMLNRPSDAIEAYRQALRIDPELAGAWNNLALAYARSGNTPAALDAVKTLRRLDPDRAEELFNLIVPR